VIEVPVVLIDDVSRVKQTCRWYWRSSVFLTEREINQSANERSNSKRKREERERERKR